MDNKIKHYVATQTIQNDEFLPLLRGEAPYFGNLNRPAQSAYNYAEDIAQILSWGGSISILNQQDFGHTFKLYEIGRIVDGEALAVATNTDDINSRYGIVVAEAAFDPISGLSTNIMVCTFCPNFVYPAGSVPTTGTAGTALYLDVADPTFLSTTTTSGIKLAKKTGTNSIFFAGTIRLF